MTPSRARRPGRRARPAAARPGARAPCARWVEIALLAFFAVVMLFPVVWMLETSLKENRDVYAVPAKFLGFDVTFHHYKDVFVQRGGSGASDLAINFKNSVIVATLSTLLATPLGVPAAWAYSRFPMKLKKDQLFFILSTRFMPPVVVVIPIFLMYRDLDLIDTKIGPDPDLRGVQPAVHDLDDEGLRRRGAGGVRGRRDARRVLAAGGLLPRHAAAAVPGIAATAVFALIFSWNEFVFSVFLTSSEDARTAPPAIAGLIGGTTVDWGLVAASAMVFAIPVLIFAFLVRKHLVAGVTLGAVRR